VSTHETRCHLLAGTFSSVKKDPKILVALIGETRAWELTAERFCSNVLDPLGADLALCGRAGEAPNPFYDRAKYIWNYAESGDWAVDYDLAVGSSDWRTLLEIQGGHFLGGLGDEQYPQIASGGILYFYRSLLGRSMEDAGVTDHYDWVVVSRSDLLWPREHPHPRYLSPRRIYTLDGEQYGGMTDRHTIVPRRYVKQFLGLTDPVFDDPKGLKQRMEQAMEEERWSLFNAERFLAWRLKELGLWRRVSYVPYVPFAVRTPDGPTSWSTGIFDEGEGYFIKYPTEKKRSDIAAEFVNDEESWRAYLAPLRGAGKRRRLKRAYREQNLYERAFPRRAPLVRAYETSRARIARAVHGARSVISVVASQVGRPVRKIPGMSAVLDARVRRIRRRDEGHNPGWFPTGAEEREWARSTGGMRAWLGCALNQAGLFRRPWSLRFESFPPVHIRFGTMDVPVLDQVFVQRQYAVHLANPPEVIVDAGAHIGLATVYFAHVFPDAGIFALEPEEENFDLLGRNTRQLDQVTLIHGALAAEPGFVSISNPEQDNWAFQVRPETSDTPGAVPAVTIPEILEQTPSGRISLLKVDIEGDELGVFESSSGWIDRVDTIVVELHDRIRPGCSEAFNRAASDFPMRAEVGDVIWASRSPDLALTAR
jgi:FkbM family methyltransferase